MITYTVSPDKKLITIFMNGTVLAQFFGEHSHKIASIFVAGMSNVKTVIVKPLNLSFSEN